MANAPEIHIHLKPDWTVLSHLPVDLGMLLLSHPFKRGRVQPLPACRMQTCIVSFAGTFNPIPLPY